MNRKITGKELRKLIEKYVDGRASAEEVEFLNLYYEEIEKKPGILHRLSNSEVTGLYERISQGVDKKIETGSGKVRYMRTLIRAAVVIGVILVAGLWYLSSDNQSVEEPKKDQIASVPILPGGNKAILTLADGTQVVLDSLQNGDISEQGGITVIKLEDGEIAYGGKNGASSNEVLFNTISTPRGGQYKIILADGSRVWLNAESSLKYPTAFAGKERKVELKGEGYFEVTKNILKPFVVEVGEMQVEVLGTEFNVNAYENEEVVRTTLLEGSVRIASGDKQEVLKPGQLAQVEKGGNEIKLIENANVEAAVSWKNGLFYFGGTSLKEIMRQISRWYDVEVEFEGDIRYRTYGGGISRSLDLKHVLEILEESDIHFRVEGKKIIVKP